MMKTVAEALDVAIEHAHWLANRRSHSRTLSDDMAVLGYPDLDRPGRRSAYQIRIATLAAIWLDLPKRGDKVLLPTDPRRSPR